MKKTNILIGAHVSIAGGLNNSIITGESIGCSAIQIFTKSSRSWNSKKITKEEETLFKETAKKSIINHNIVAHTSYLINLGCPKSDIEKKSIKALEDELLRCDQLQIPYLVLHPGAHLGSGEEKCINQIAQNINLIFENIKLNTILLLENTAGQGSTIGYNFEQLASIYNKIHRKKNIGICFDTCHGFVAGYDISTKKEYQETWNKFENIIGLNLLKVIHLNDSKGDLGSKLDRHEKIGKGKIGIEGFKLIMQDSKFKNIPKILETPLIKSIKEYQEEIILLKKLAK